MALLNDADMVYKGSVEVDAIYKGSILVWQNEIREQIAHSISVTSTPYYTGGGKGSFPTGGWTQSGWHNGMTPSGGNISLTFYHSQVAFDDGSLANTISMIFSYDDTVYREVVPPVIPTEQVIQVHFPGVGWLSADAATSTMTQYAGLTSEGTQYNGRTEFAYHWNVNPPSSLESTGTKIITVEYLN